MNLPKYGLIVLVTCFTCTEVVSFACSGRYNDVSYCRYEPGDINSNIIITAPHGGFLKPKSIPDRHAGCLKKDGTCTWSHTCNTRDTKRCKVSLLKDTYTKEIAVMVADYLKEFTSKRPHLIINELHRSKMDGNREDKEATFGNSDARSAYYEFHGMIQAATRAVKSRGLVIDIHGQAQEPFVELGYTVLKSHLNKDKPVAIYSSLKYLDKQSSYTFRQILRGSKSLGHYLQNEMVNTIPSPRYPKPLARHYFKGGYIIKQYGSRYRGSIDAIQVEIPKVYRNKEKGKIFAKKLARAINNFVKKHY